MFAHNYTQPPIGKATRVWKSDGQLKFNIEFAKEEDYPFADTVYRLYKGGFMKATSVGFIPDPDSIVEGDGEKAPKRTYKKQELLELSAVPVPSNPNALVQAQEEGVITIKEFNEITKPEETDDFIRIPVSECKVTATIDISKKEGISALYCGKEKQVKTYLFDKRDPHNWTMAKAKKWVEDHKAFEELVLGPDYHIGEKQPPQAKEMSQQGVLDELDYLIRLIDTVGLNEEAMKDAWGLVEEVMRLAGNDIPEDILEKIGAVLNQKNKDRLNQIQNLAQSILDSAKEESIEATETKGLDKEAIAKLVKDEINKLQGKI